MNFHFERKTVRRLERELKTAQHLNNVQLYKMVQCMLLISKQKNFIEIADILHICPKTVYIWFREFLMNQFSWLIGFHYIGRGRKSRLSSVQKQKLFVIVAEGPQNYGFSCGVWNSAMLTEIIMKEFGIFYNPRYVCRLLHKIGLSFQKAKFVSDKIDDPEFIKARKKWEKITFPKIVKDAQKRNAVILFIDEVSFAQWGSLSRTWAPRGKQPIVKTCGKRKGLKMFGAIEFKSGDFLYQECDEKFNADSYILFLKYTLKNYRRPIFLIEDGAPYHKSKKASLFKKEMADKGRLYTYSLPSYSPEYNPIEKLWKKTKKDATHLKYFPDFESLRNAVIYAFKMYMNDAIHVISIMKSLRKKYGLAA